LRLGLIINKAALHNHSYDFPDMIIESGTELSFFTIYFIN